jgi:hypothetical protein
MARASKGDKMAVGSIFITGSNAKLQVDGITLAYATDVQYSARTNHVPVETFGCYSVRANEPISYEVSGSFNVVRYTKIPAVDKNPTRYPGMSDKGNGIGAWQGTANDLSTGNSTIFNPGEILRNKTIDIVLFSKQPQNSESVDLNNVVTAEDKGIQQRHFSTIKDARIISMSAAINKRGVVMMSYQFVGILWNDSTFDSSPSNLGNDKS